MQRNPIVPMFGKVAGVASEEVTVKLFET